MSTRARYCKALGAVTFYMSVLTVCGGPSSDLDSISDRIFTVGEQITYDARRRDGGVILIKELGPTASCGRIAKVTIRNVLWESPSSSRIRNIQTLMSFSALSRIATGSFTGEDLEPPTGEDIVLVSDFENPEIACSPGYQSPNRLIRTLKILDTL